MEGLLDHLSTQVRDDLSTRAKLLIGRSKFLSLICDNGSLRYSSAARMASELLVSTSFPGDSKLQYRGYGEMVARAKGYSWHLVEAFVLNTKYHCIKKATLHGSLNFKSGNI